MSKKRDWSQHWKQSQKPSKQRKYRRNAPLHQRHKLLKARLSAKWKEKLSFSTLPLREGDKVKVMRGDHRGDKGEVANIDYDHLKVELEELKREKVDGSDARVPLSPSNLMITRPNLDDDLRAKRVEEIKQIKQEMEEEEEQEAESEEEQEKEELEEEEKELETKEEELEGELAEEEEEQKLETKIEAELTSPQSLVQETIASIKEQVEDYEQELADEDQEKLIARLKELKEAEKDNENRKTLLSYLEGKIDEYAD